MSTNTNNTATTAPHRKNAAVPIRSESPYQGRTAQKDNPTQAIIRQAVDFLIQQVQAGKSETLTAYLAAMSRFRNYSFGNILAIARQKPTATRVAGYGAWKEMGRFVKRGEKGIEILAPVTGYRRKKDDTQQETEEKPRPVLIGFRVVHVFDVAQTEGADLPEYDFNITGEVGEYRDRLRDFLAQRGIELELSERIAPALGVSYGGKIALLPGQPKAQEFVTLVHETAHLCCVRSYVA
jgi:antirestriction protein ArdC